MFIVTHRKIWYALSFVLIGLSIWSLTSFGLKRGIEFTGGSLLEVTFTNTESAPTIDTIQESLANQGFGAVSVRTAGSTGGELSYIIRLREISNEEKNQILSVLGATLKDFNNVGPTLGAEAERKSAVSIVLVLLAIVLFVTFAFRKVSRSQNIKLSSWVYGGVAIAALVHDVLIPMGVFAFLGHYLGYEIDTLFVTALLVILGFSVHDTIVVFDRVRESLVKTEGKRPFEQIVGDSISETLSRSINTSLTTLLAVVALYVWGPESTRLFALTMGLGILIGTYSSLCFASPLLVTLNKWKSRRS